MNIIIQQLTQNTYYNLNNLNQTFSKVDEKHFIDNTLGNLYNIISFESSHQTYTIKEL